MVKIIKIKQVEIKKVAQFTPQTLGAAKQVLEGYLPQLSSKRQLDAVKVKTVVETILLLIAEVERLNSKT